MTILISTFSLQAKLLDKIVAVFNQDILTKGQITRMSQNLPARYNISRHLFPKVKMTEDELIKIIIRSKMIRKKLAAMNYIIGDDRVEAHIKNTEKNLRLTREALLQFLKSNNLTFNEYFELIRESIEFQIFHSRIIRPLISVTDQEIKNAFIKENYNNSTVTLKYSLVDFYLPKSNVKKGMLNRFQKVMETYQTKGILPEDFKNISTTMLGDVSEDGLSSKIKNAVKLVEEGKFSKPVLLGGLYHVFFVKKKDVIETEFYTKAKKRIKSKLFEEYTHKMTKLWFEREQNKFYIRYF